MQPQANSDIPFPNSTNAVPPKFPLEESTAPTSLPNVLKSLVIYIGLGYLLLRRWDLLLILLGILLLHEAGHFIAMKYYRYADIQILFLPFMGALIKGSKKEISQKQSIVILLAGPLPGLLLGIVLYFVHQSHQQINLGNVSLYFIAQLLIWANFVNLLPIYPLDGGQLFNRVYLKEEGLLSDIFFCASMLAIIITVFYFKFYILLALPVLLIYKYFKSRATNKLDKALERSDIDVNIDYNKLSDTDYWKIRTIVIEETPSLKHIATHPPYTYHVAEHKIAAEIQAVLLPRMLLLDASISNKIITALLWAGVISLPWLLNIDFTLIQFLNR